MGLQQVFMTVFPDHKVLDISNPRDKEVVIFFDRYGIDAKLYLKRIVGEDLMIKCCICDNCPSYLRIKDIIKLSDLIEEHKLL